MSTGNHDVPEVRTNDTIGAKWLASEMSVREWMHGRYRVDRAAPDYLTSRIKDRTGDCLAGGRTAVKTS